MGKNGLPQADDKSAGTVPGGPEVAANAEDKEAGANAAMSARRAKAGDDEAGQDDQAHRQDQDGAGGQDVIQLAQADGSSTGSAGRTGSVEGNADAPVSVGEELLRQAAPLPVSKPVAADGFESWFGKDWKMPLAIGGGALALLGLAAGGGGGGGGGGSASATPAAPTLAADKAATPVNAIPANMYGLTITPAAGPFLAGANVRASVQKLMADGSWQEVGSTTIVDASGHMLALVYKNAVGANDMLRVILSDSNPGAADYNDEVAGPQSLGAVQLQALIGALTDNAAVTVSPLSTQAANLVGRDLSATHVNAVNSAVAQAFGLHGGDLIHTAPAFVNAAAGSASTDAQNYGLALGIVAGMTQAQRDAHVASPLQATLDLLSNPANAVMKTKPDGSFSLDLSALRQQSVTDSTNNASVAVGLDAGAARLYAAANSTTSAISGAQVPYVQVDTHAEGAAASTSAPPAWSNAAISYANFINGLTLNVSPAASAKVGDQLLIEFLPLDAQGKVVADASPFRFAHTYTYTNDDFAQVSSGGSNGMGSFSVTVPTYDSNALGGKAVPSNSNPANYLFGVDASQHYTLGVNGIAGYQMRASGAVVGVLGAGGSFNVDPSPVSIVSGPVGGGTVFNGEPTGSNTVIGTNIITVSLSLPQGIIWNGAPPSLELTVGGTGGAAARTVTATLAMAPGTMGGSTLIFKAVLSNTSQDATAGLNGALSIGPYALIFAPGTALSDVSGNPLFDNKSGVWQDSQNHTNLSGDISSALGVSTQLLNTGFTVDTLAPPNAVFDFTNLSAAGFDAGGQGRHVGAPVAGMANSVPSSVSTTPYAVYIGQVQQGFKVTFPPGLDMTNELNGKVILYAQTGNGTDRAIIASTSITGAGSQYGAEFTPTSYASYQDAIQKFVSRSVNAPLQLDYSIQVMDAAGNKSAVAALAPSGGSTPYKVFLETQAPAAPGVSLASGSDSGRAGDTASRSDNLTNVAQPSIHITGPNGNPTYAQITNAAGVVVGSGWLISTVGAEAISTNQADLPLSSAAAMSRGLNNFTVTLTDAAGNVSTPVPIAIDYLPAQATAYQPALSFGSTAPHNGFYIEGDIIKVQVKFDRAVYLKNGLTGVGLRLSLGDSVNNTKSLSADYAGGSGTDTLTFTHTVARGDDSVGQYATSTIINMTQLEDGAGSPLASTSTGIASPILDPAQMATAPRVDTTPPAVPVLVLAPDVGAHSGSASLGTATGSSGVLSLTAEKDSSVVVTFTNTNAAGASVNKTVTGLDGTSVPVALSTEDIAKLGQGTINVTAKATDVAGNVGNSSAAATFTLDTIAPTIGLVTDNLASPTKPTNQAVVFTVPFSKPLNRPLGTDDFEVDHGTISSVTPVSAGSNTYTVTVALPPAQSATTLALSLAQTSNPVTDRAGNALVVGTLPLASQAIDTQGPQVKNVDVSGSVRGSVLPGGTAFDFIVSFDEKIDGAGGSNVLGTGNFTLIGGGPGAMVTKVQAMDADAQGSSQYRVTVNPGSLSGHSNLIKLGMKGFTNLGGTVVDALGNYGPDQSDLGGVGGSVTINAQAPTVTSAALSSGTVKDGNPQVSNYYHAGDTVMAVLGFDEPVTVTGQPTLQLTIGGTTRTAVFDHVDPNGSKVYFKYILVTADNTGSGIAIPANALGLPSGAAITDAAGNSATNATSAASLAPANPAYLVDNIAPHFVSATVAASAASPSGKYTTGALINATMSFDDAVAVTGTPTLTLDLGGGNTATATYLNQSSDHKTLNFSYTVIAGANTVGSTGIAIPANALMLPTGSSVTDASGNAVVVNSSAVPGNVIIDTLAPTVTNIQLSGTRTSGLYHKGDMLTATVTFSEPLAAIALADQNNVQLSLQVNSMARTASFVSQSGNTMTFGYTVSDGDTGGPITIPRNAVQLRGVVVLSDDAGNQVRDSVTSQPVGAIPNITVDNTAPVLTDIGSATANGLYGLASAPIEVHATSSKPLQSNAVVTLTLDNGGTVTLTRDASNATLLKGNYVVQKADHNSDDLTVATIALGANAMDLAGNRLSTDLPPSGHNLGDLSSIKINTVTPPTPTGFRLADGSDAGSSPADGLTNVNQPSFQFSGLTAGATVKVTATFPDNSSRSFSFQASGAPNEIHTLTSTVLADGNYTNVVVTQTLIGGINASAPQPLQNTLVAGSMTINTQAPTVTPSQVVFDDQQDRQTQDQFTTGVTTGTLPRDYRTTITTPRFDFMGGNVGDTAVLFRDINGNGVFGPGDIVLGTAPIGAQNVISYPDFTSNAHTPPQLSGHYVDVKQALPNNPYNDIWLAFQSNAGTIGGAVKAFSSGNGFQVAIQSLSPAIPLTSASTDQVGGVTTNGQMKVTLAGGQPGASVAITAVDPTGKTVTLGSGILNAANPSLTLDVSALQGSYSNFQAVQTWNSRASAAVSVTQGGNSLGSVTWDHIAPTVNITSTPGLDPADTTNQYVVEGGAVKTSLTFSFSKAVTGFTADDVSLPAGATLSNLVMNAGNTGATANLTLAAGYSATTVSVQVKDASYTSAAGVSGKESSALVLPVDHLGSVRLTGGTGPNGAVKVGDVLTANLLDLDARAPDPFNPGHSSVQYEWSRIGVGGVQTPLNQPTTATTYQLVQADVGAVIKVHVSYIDQGGGVVFRPDSVETRTSNPVIGSDAPGTVSITKPAGLLYPDVQLEADANAPNLNAHRDTVSYSWFRDGNDTGESGKFYTLVNADIGHVISAHASYTDDAGNAASLVSAGQNVVAANQPGTVTIAHVDTSLSATVFHAGDVLTASASDPNGPLPGNVSYQWSRDGAAIPTGGTGSQYILTAADVGHSMSVQVRYTDAVGYSESPTAPAISVTAFDNHPPAGLPRFPGGSAMVGSILTVDGSGVTDADVIPTSGPGAPTYQWSIRGSDGTSTPISDTHLLPGFADHSKLQLTSDLAGGQIIATMTYTDGGHTVEHVVSAPIQVTWAPSYALAAPASLSFAGAPSTPASAPLAKLIQLKGSTLAADSGLYILDVNGDGSITQADATAYITSLDAGGSLMVQTKTGTGTGTAKATLLSATDPAWAALTSDPGNPLGGNGSNGTATGKSGALVNGTPQPAGDFWTSSPGNTSTPSSHQVYSTDIGVYSRPDASSLAADPGRLHYNIFHLAVMPV